MTAIARISTWARIAAGWRRSLHPGRGATLLPAVLLAVLLLGGGFESGLAAAQGCQTPFVVFTDPANPGMTSQSGDIAFTQDSRLLGEYGGNGRFAGYDIDGSMVIINNTATGMARVQGEFIATSPDGASSITVWYTGQVDFAGLMATGNFVAGNGTGADAGYRASGMIVGTVTPPATLEGADIGLC